MIKILSEGPAPTPTRRTDAVNAPDGAKVERAFGELRKIVRGEVRSDAGSRALYSTDASNYRQIPYGVVLPKDAGDVEQTLRVARAYGLPIVSRGGGTSLAGETTNAAIVLDFSKYMNRVVEMNYDGKYARVEPGCVLDDLRDLAEKKQLTFPPDPSTHNRNTLGGMIGNNSCGMHAQMGGKTERNIEELEIITYDGVRMTVGPTSDEELEKIIAAGGRKGEIYAKLREIRDTYADLIRKKFPKIPRRVSGFPLDQLLPENGFNVARALVGTEGTCVTVLQAKCRLIHSPPHRVLCILGFPDIATAADWVPFCNEFGPIALEGMDDSMFRHLELKHKSTQARSAFPDAKAWLIVQFGADDEKNVKDQAQKLADAITAKDGSVSYKIESDAKQMEEVWKVREAGLGITAKIPNERDTYPGWEDSAVAPDRLGDYIRDFEKLLDRYGYTASLYGHFGQACLHCRINFDLFTREGIDTYKRFARDAAHLCVQHGGSLSGEHGDGQSRGALLPIMFGEELCNAFWEFKTAWDPDNRMNPGKVVHPYAIDENLRWGTNYEPWEPQTHFSFKEDRGSFAYAANRCVGAGVCRKHDGGTMCPSYMATREEMHSTRGRERLLFEMLQSNPLEGGWKNEAVKEALDLCLACKGCKSECPVNVDMATYKAEFLAHYFEGRLRPRNAYAFGWMMYWARIASKAPWLANALAQAPVLNRVAKWAARMDQRRRIPPFASRTFREWFLRERPSTTRSANASLRVTREGSSVVDAMAREGSSVVDAVAKEYSSATGGVAKRVILWADTWNDHFHPQTAIAAVEVLEDAGFEVTIPRKVLCCGRPLYDYGMLDQAKGMLGEILDELRDEIRAGTPVVGLEPSCVSVLRDEMTDLLRDDNDASRLAKQTFMFSEFLTKFAPEYQPKLEGVAIVHQHCHHKSILDPDAERTLLEKTGVDYSIPDDGCCGMAGAFGFEEGHYDVSIACGERVLLPEVRKASRETIVVADGFSCREQIAQTTERLAIHPAELLRMAIDGERPSMPDPREEAAKARRIGALILGAVVIAGVAVGLRLASRIQDDKGGR